jgi:hypothetical protein
MCRQRSQLNLRNKAKGCATAGIFTVAVARVLSAGQDAEEINIPNKLFQRKIVKILGGAPTSLARLPASGGKFGGVKVFQNSAFGFSQKKFPSQAGRPSGGGQAFRVRSQIIKPPKSWVVL